MPPNNTRWPYPGKILIIDDEFNDDITTAVDQLLKNGVPVEYWKGSEPTPILSNTRVVLLDLILRPEDDYLTGQAKFGLAIEAISKVHGASIVIIFSRATDEPSDFEEAYVAKKGKFPGVIAKEKMKKTDLSDPKKLITLIESSIKEHPEVRLALVLESAIDFAKDGAFESTLGKNVDVVAALVKIMQHQAGKEGLRKELVDTMIRILSRHAHSGQADDELSKVLKEIFEKSAHDLADESLLSLLMYHKPQKEKLWTGDIFLTGKTDGRDVAIVVTPACDLAQDKTGFVTVAFGFSLTPDVLTNHNSILFVKDETLRDCAARLSEPQKATGRLALESQIKKRGESYTITGEKLPAWAHILHHVDLKGNIVAVCLDLNDVERVPTKNLEGKAGQWERIARLDSPYIEALLQKFGGHLSRIGVPDVNFSLKEISKKAAKALATATVEAN